MGARGEQIVDLAFEGFTKRARSTAQEVVALDARIDQDDLEIHALILRMLALRQPVADDLRFLATALRLATDLERIGDEAVNIAERAVEQDVDASDSVSSDLGTMACATRNMLHSALDAFVRGDDEQADRVLGCDDEVDRRCAAIIATMTTYISAHPSEADAGLRVVRVAKYLERIADHATNVAEETIFMVRGDDVRHGRWRSEGALDVADTVAHPSGGI
jgi:phosphate transport system protein